MEAFSSFDRSMLEQAITRNLQNYILRFPELGVLMEDLKQCGQTVLFGGSVRDQIHQSLHGEAALSRDLDFVVDGTISFFRSGDEKNNFGGWRSKIDANLKIDYWELGGTYAFRKGYFAATMENLPKTTVYSPNACIYDLQSKKLIDNGAVKDIAKREVAFNCRSYLDLFPDYQAFRAIELANRMGYSLKQDVLQFVRVRINTTPWNSFVTAVQQHRRDLVEEQIRELCIYYQR